MCLYCTSLSEEQAQDGLSTGAAAQNGHFLAHAAQRHKDVDEAAEHAQRPDKAGAVAHAGATYHAAARHNVGNHDQSYGKRAQVSAAGQKAGQFLRAILIPGRKLHVGTQPNDNGRIQDEDNHDGLLSRSRNCKSKIHRYFSSLSSATASSLCVRITLVATIMQIRDMHR